MNLYKFETQENIFIIFQEFWKQLILKRPVMATFKKKKKILKQSNPIAEINKKWLQEKVNSI